MTRRKKKPKSITVVGRRWFNRGPGNTYHSVTIHVDGHSHVVPFEYGYGTHYLDTARAWLKKNGYLPGIKEHAHGGGEPLWRYCERVGCDLTDEVSDVSRRKDLHNGGRK